MERELTNPYINKVSNELDVFDGKACSYGGIISKIIYFFLITFLGVGSYLFIPIPKKYISFVLIVAVAIIIIVPFLSYLILKATLIFGSIFCLAEGYIVGYFCVKFSKLYNAIVPLAIIITFSVVLVMLVLYGTKIIKVNQKFRAIISALLLTSVVFRGIIFMSSFFTEALTSVFNDGGLVGIGIAIIILMIAVLNLVVDFDNIAKGVKDGFAKRYEWILAFGIVTSIIFIFLRVLKFLAQLIGDDDDE
ncbi:Bax inhibitor-1/YccA family membrane protein [Clostridium oceanicum]|uniref:Bax inhibitor 1 like protein n=1 Tax=Clostridium oceanicum TaxID=1543 RepID=A0ABN1JMC4_9CLOT